jgi:hypothetical protein
MKKSQFYIFLYKVYSKIVKNIKYLKNLTNWFFVYFFNRDKKKDKLLFIYDLTYQPFSVGDFLVANAASLAICEKYLMDNIDLLIVFDIKNINKSMEFKNINSDNIYYNIASILPIAQVNQKIASILIFNNKIQVDKYIKDNINKYTIYPNLLTYGIGNYLYWDAMNKILPEYFKKNGHAPNFICREHLRIWGNNFFVKNVGKSIAVTINIRNNKSHGQNRNSNIKEWNKFFKYCNNKFDVKFIILCSINEIDQCWEDFENVIIAKKHHTNIEHDLALINLSSFHMGSPSGPFSMAWFGDKPYINFNIDVDRIAEYTSIIKNDEYYKFSFALDNQLMTAQSEQFEVILYEFNNLYKSIMSSTFINSNIKMNTNSFEGMPFLR